MSVATLPRWIRLCGACTLPGTYVVALRLAWEATYLTGRQGPQMLGFSLAHSAWAVPRLASLVGAAVWLAGFAGWSVLRASQGARPASRDLVWGCVVGAPLGVVTLVAWLT